LREVGQPGAGPEKGTKEDARGERSQNGKRGQKLVAKITMDDQRISSKISKSVKVNKESLCCTKEKRRNKM